MGGIPWWLKERRRGGVLGRSAGRRQHVCCGRWPGCATATATFATLGRPAGDVWDGKWGSGTSRTSLERGLVRIRRHVCVRKSSLVKRFDETSWCTCAISACISALHRRNIWPGSVHAARWITACHEALRSGAGRPHRRDPGVGVGRGLARRPDGPLPRHHAGLPRPAGPADRAQPGRLRVGELSIGILSLSRRCRSRSSGSVPFRRAGAGCGACRPRRLRSRHG